MKLGSLFTGYGGLDMAVEKFFGAATVWACDIDPGASKIIQHRIDAPNLGDITKINWGAVEPVHIVTAGWPCQPFSLAGKRKGADDERALWPQVTRAIRLLRPRVVVLENVAAIASAGELARAVGDLSSLGYVGQWRCVRAADVGAPHGRARIFVFATDTEGDSRRVSNRNGEFATDPEGERHQRGGVAWGGRQRSSNGDLAAADTDDNKQDQHEGTDGPTHIGTTEGRSELRARGRGEPVADARSSRWGKGDTRGRDLVGQSRIQGGRDESPGASGPHRDAATDPNSERHGRRQNSGMVGQLDSQEESPAQQRERPRGQPGHRSSKTNWGAYEPAIRRWEHILGRLAPAPTETSPAWIAARQRRLSGKHPARIGFRGSLRHLLTPTQRLSPAFVEWMMGLPAGWVTDVPELNRNAQLKALGNGVVPQQAYAALQLMAEHAGMVNAS